MAVLDDIRDGKGLKPITSNAQQESICYKCEYSNDCGMVTHLKRSGTVMVGCSKFKEKHKQTNADRIRSMTDEEIEVWYWWMNKKMMGYTDSRMFVHDWLKAPAGEGE